MNTGSAATRAAAAEAWTPVLRSAGADGRVLGGQILAVAHEIASKGLRGPLTDPGRTAEDKARLASRLFAGKVDDRVVALLQALVRGRWSRPVDLISALHDLGIEAVLVGSQADESISHVEQEVLEVSQALDSDPELRQALEPSRTTRTEDRVRLAQRLLAPHLSQAAMDLVTWCVRHEAEGGVPRNLRRVAELAAGLQNRTIADVVTAVPMTTAQETRLREILSRRLGTEVELNTEVDPAVVGGVRVSVRDLVIDSTVRSSVAELRTALAG
ncbi:F0F1 ATP synthase subunit delta [Actinomyces haliotis]|uniref:F0F1 ATP synthase subunit delta n=1 Tax=Actinomyces haliotis TaxID=1280843 RepID=UPI00188FC5E3|nr:F0F1 ATP synthase subunit delta [Actinomyces haliotis]